MSIDNRHIIRKQIIELELPAQQGALQLQRKVARLYKDEVKQQLEKVFDGLDLKGQTLRIPRLEIELGMIAPDQLERIFVEKCVQAIQQEVEKQAIQFTANLKNTGAAIPKTEDISIFFYFLKNGTLPWYASYASMAELEEKILNLLPANTNNCKTLFRDISQNNRRAITRLVYQFSENFLNRLLERIWQFEPGQWQLLLSEIETIAKARISSLEKRQLYKAVFIHVIREQVFVPSAFSKLQEKVEKAIGQTIAGRTEKIVIQLARQQFFAEANLSIKEFVERVVLKINEQKPFGIYAPEPQKETPEKTSEQPEPPLEMEGQQEREPEINQKEGWYIDNAGLVICAYFLKPFFKGLGLWEDGQFKDKTAQHRAVHLSHFLVTGEENPAEFMLLLNKIICGLPTNEPVTRMLELTATEKEEAENLLGHVIKYWTMLGNTSVDSLRNTFLKRKGKLRYERSRSRWQLQVEEKGYDICVEQLPWTISLIKLPWMKNPLMVDWM